MKEKIYKKKNKIKKNLNFSVYNFYLEGSFYENGD